MPLPKWVTRERTNYLVDLFGKCGGFCVYNHKFCEVPSHQYETVVEKLIDQWVEDDRESRFYQESLDSQRIPSKAYTGPCLTITRQGIDHAGVPIIEVNIREAPVTLFVSSEPKIKVKSTNRRHKEARYWHKKAVNAYDQYWDKQGKRA